MSQACDGVARRHVRTRASAWWSLMLVVASTQIDAQDHAKADGPAAPPVMPILAAAQKSFEEVRDTDTDGQATPGSFQQTRAGVTDLLLMKVTGIGASEPNEAPIITGTSSPVVGTSNVRSRRFRRRVRCGRAIPTVTPLPTRGGSAPRRLSGRQQASSFQSARRSRPSPPPTATVTRHRRQSR